MQDAVLDLSRATLIKACKGDVTRLPSFIVYDEDQWPWFNQVRPAKGKLHIRRSTFLRVVAPQVPVREGLWTGPHTQEFFIDLKAHQLGGSTDAKPANKNHELARKIAVADEAGRLPDEADYGTPVVERSSVRQEQLRDLADIEARGEKRGVSSAVFAGVRGTD